MAFVHTELVSLVWRGMSPTARYTPSRVALISNSQQLPWLHMLAYAASYFLSTVEYSNFWSECGYHCIFSLLSIFWRNKSCLMRSPCCPCIYESPSINFWMPEPVVIRPGMYIIAPEPISTAYFRNPSHQSLCLSCVPPIGLGKHVSAVTNTRMSVPIIARWQPRKDDPATTKNC
jgi:hypothetical protein